MAKLKYKRFPGDTIVVPMLIGVLLNSFIPQVFRNWGDSLQMLCMEQVLWLESSYSF